MGIFCSSPGQAGVQDDNQWHAVAGVLYNKTLYIMDPELSYKEGKGENGRLRKGEISGVKVPMEAGFSRDPRVKADRVKITGGRNAGLEMCVAESLLALVDVATRMVEEEDCNPVKSCGWMMGLKLYDVVS